MYDSAGQLQRVDLKMGLPQDVRKKLFAAINKELSLGDESAGDLRQKISSRIEDVLNEAAECYSASAIVRPGNKTYVPLAKLPREKESYTTSPDFLVSADDRAAWVSLISNHPDGRIVELATMPLRLTRQAIIGAVRDCLRKCS